MQLIGIILIIMVAVLFWLWLWYTKNQTGVAAKESGGRQVFDVIVKGVYSPNIIRAKLGEPIRINFTRQEDNECSRFVNFSDWQIRRELPAGRTVTIEITPTGKGEFIFACDMGMYQGKLIVE
ncbi:MAG: cupredoxin domain-containing protein [Patescibacteria group bacterium]